MARTWCPRCRAAVVFAPTGEFEYDTDHTALERRRCGVDATHEMVWPLEVWARLAAQIVPRPRRGDLSA